MAKIITRHRREPPRIQNHYLCRFSFFSPPKMIKKKTITIESQTTNSTEMIINWEFETSSNYLWRDYMIMIYDMINPIWSARLMNELKMSFYFHSQCPCRPPPDLFVTHYCSKCISPLSAQSSLPVCSPIIVIFFCRRLQKGAPCSEGNSKRRKKYIHLPSGIATRKKREAL